MSSRLFWLYYKMWRDFANMGQFLSWTFLFSIAMSDITRGKSHQIPLNHHFPMVFLRFSYGFPKVFLWFYQGGTRARANQNPKLLGNLQISPQAHALWSPMLGSWLQRGNPTCGYSTVSSGNLTQLWKITIFYGKIHYKWQFSIAMFVYQRVCCVFDGNKRYHQQVKN